MTVAPERRSGRLAVPVAALGAVRRARARRGADAALLRRARQAVTVALPPWLVGRGIVLGALAMAHLVVSRAHPTDGAVVRTVHQGLLAWDAGWYEAIARVGYAPLGHQALRFFPLLPLAARGLAVVPGISAGAAVVIIANVSALVGTTLLYVLVRRELGDEATARRSVWLLALLPPAFTLVMGYAEGTLLVWTVGCFLALRPAAGHRPAWGWAAVLGAAAALTRPLGVLLALAVIVEGARHWRRAGYGERARICLAVAGPGLGLVAFLAWVQVTAGNFFDPVRVQVQAGHHGGLTDPFATLWDDARGVLHHHLGTALHVPWVLLVVVVVAVCWRRLPAAYGAFATGVVLVAITGTNLDSFERYALSAWPLVVTGALLLASARVERLVLALAAAGLFAYALLAFLGLSVP